MKDTVRSRSEGLIQKHPKLFNVFLILALISLVFAGAFLLSDIMSFKSNSAQKGPLCAFSLKLPNECKTTIVKTWQEKGVNLIGQLKSFLNIKGTAKNLDKDSARDKARALLVKNRQAKAKEARLRTENLSHQEIPMNLANSSGVQTSVQPSQSTNTFIVSSGESEGSYDYPYYYSESDSSSKDIENDTRFGSVTSNISENQLPSDESVANDSIIGDSTSSESATNEPIENNSASNDSVPSEPTLNDSYVNEPVTNEPIVNGSVLNDSVIGDSIIKMSAIDKPAVNESASNESGMNELMDNGSVSSGSVSDDSVLNKPIMNESAANKSAINGSSMNESEVESQIKRSNTNQSQMNTNLSSSTPESLAATDQGNNGTGNNFSPRGSKNTDTSYKLSRELQSLPDSNETSNLFTNNDDVQGGAAKNESQHTVPYQKNDSTSDVLTSSNKGIPNNSVPDKISNITSGKVIESFDGQSNSTPAVKAISAGNSTPQSQEPNQTYNQSESKPLLDGSSTPHNPMPNNKTQGLQNNLVENTGKNNKKVSTNSTSAQSQQSKIGKTNSASRFRTLKVPTPSWMTKA